MKNHCGLIELALADLGRVAGGLNPQPLPPGLALSTNPDPMPWHRADPWPQPWRVAGPTPAW